MIRIESVLVADEIEQECLDLLSSKGIKVEKKIKLAKDALIAELKNFDAVLVRSATKITADIIQATTGKLKLIGRAGTGVDNIDVKAATEYGVVVINTPGRPSCHSLVLRRRIWDHDSSTGLLFHFSRLSSLHATPARPVSACTCMERTVTSSKEEIAPSDVSILFVSQLGELAGDGRKKEP